MGSAYSPTPLQEDGTSQAAPQCQESEGTEKGGYRGRQKRKSGNAGGESDTDIIHGEGTAQSQRLRESQIPMFGKFFLLPA